MLVPRLLWLVPLVGICALHESAFAEEVHGDDLFTERIAVKNTADDVPIFETTPAINSEAATTVDYPLDFHINTNEYQGFENSENETIYDYQELKSSENETIDDYQSLENSENETIGDYQGFGNSENDSDSNISVKELLEGNFTNDGLKGINIIRNWMKGLQPSREIDITNVPINGNIENAEILEATVSDDDNEPKYESTSMYNEPKTQIDITDKDIIKAINEFESNIQKEINDLENDIKTEIKEINKGDDDETTPRTTIDNDADTTPRITVDDAETTPETSNTKLNGNDQTKGIIIKGNFENNTATTDKTDIQTPSSSQFNNKSEFENEELIKNTDPLLNEESSGNGPIIQNVNVDKSVDITDKDNLHSNETTANQDEDMKNPVKTSFVINPENLKNSVEEIEITEVNNSHLKNSGEYASIPITDIPHYTNNADDETITEETNLQNEFNYSAGDHEADSVMETTDISDDRKNITEESITEKDHQELNHTVGDSDAMQITEITDYTKNTDEETITEENILQNEFNYSASDNEADYTIETTDISEDSKNVKEESITENNHLQEEELNYSAGDSGAIQTTDISDNTKNADKQTITDENNLQNELNYSASDSEADYTIETTEISEDSKNATGETIREKNHLQEELNYSAGDSAAIQTTDIPDYTKNADEETITEENILQNEFNYSASDNEADYTIETTDISEDSKNVKEESITENNHLQEEELNYSAGDSGAIQTTDISDNTKNADKQTITDENNLQNELNYSASDSEADYTIETTEISEDSKNATGETIRETNHLQEELNYSAGDSAAIQTTDIPDYTKNADEETITEENNLQNEFNYSASDNEADYTIETTDISEDSKNVKKESIMENNHLQEEELNYSADDSGAIQTTDISDNTKNADKQTITDENNLQNELNYSASDSKNANEETIREKNHLQEELNYSAGDSTTIETKDFPVYTKNADQKTITEEDNLQNELNDSVGDNEADSTMETTNISEDLKNANEDIITEKNHLQEELNYTVGNSAAIQITEIPDYTNNTDEETITDENNVQNELNYSASDNDADYTIETTDISEDSKNVKEETITEKNHLQEEEFRYSDGGSAAIQTMLPHYTKNADEQIITEENNLRNELNYSASGTEADYTIKTTNISEDSKNVTEYEETITEKSHLREELNYSSGDSATIVTKDISDIYTKNADQETVTEENNFQNELNHSVGDNEADSTMETTNISKDHKNAIEEIITEKNHLQEELNYSGGDSAGIETKDISEYTKNADEETTTEENNLQNELNYSVGDNEDDSTMETTNISKDHKNANEEIITDKKHLEEELNYSAGDSAGIETKDIPEYTKNTDEDTTTEENLLQYELNYSASDNEADYVMITTEISDDSKNADEESIHLQEELNYSASDSGADTESTIQFEPSTELSTYEYKDLTDTSIAQEEDEEVSVKENVMVEAAFQDKVHSLNEENKYGNNQSTSLGKQYILNGDGEDLEITSSDNQFTSHNDGVEDIKTQSVENQSTSNYNSLETSDVNNSNEAQSTSGGDIKLEVSKEESEKPNEELTNSVAEDPKINKEELSSAILETEISDEASEGELESGNIEHNNQPSNVLQSEDTFESDDQETKESAQINEENVTLINKIVDIEQLKSPINSNENNSSKELEDSLTKQGYSTEKTEFGIKAYSNIKTAQETDSTEETRLYTQENVDSTLTTEHSDLTTQEEIYKVLNERVEGDETKKAVINASQTALFEIEEITPEEYLNEENDTTVQYSIPKKNFEALESEGWEVVDDIDQQEEVSSQQSTVSTNHILNHSTSLLQTVTSEIHEDAFTTEISSTASKVAEDDQVAENVKEPSEIVNDWNNENSVEENKGYSASTLPEIIKFPSTTGQDIDKKKASTIETTDFPTITGQYLDENKAAEIETTTALEHGDTMSVNILQPANPKTANIEEEIENSNEPIQTFKQIPAFKVHDESKTTKEVTEPVEQISEEVFEAETFNLEEEDMDTRTLSSEFSINPYTTQLVAEKIATTNDYESFAASLQQETTDEKLEDMTTPNSVQVFENSINSSNDQQMLIGESYVTPIIQSTNEINNIASNEHLSEESHKKLSAESHIQAANSILEIIASSTENILINNEDFNIKSLNEEDKEIIEGLEKILLDKMEEDILEEEIEKLVYTTLPITADQEKEEERNDLKKTNEVTELMKSLKTHENDYEEELEEVEHAIEEAANDLPANQKLVENMLNSQDDGHSRIFTEFTTLVSPVINKEISTYNNERQANSDYIDKLNDVEQIIEEVSKSVKYEANALTEEQLTTPNSQVETVMSTTTSAVTEEVINKEHTTLSNVNEDNNETEILIEEKLSTYISPLDIIVSGETTEITTEVITIPTTESYGVFSFFKNIYGYMSGSSTTEEAKIAVIQTTESEILETTTPTSIREYIIKSVSVDDISKNTMLFTRNEDSEATTMAEFITEHIINAFSVDDLNLSTVDFSNSEDITATTIAQFITTHSKEFETESSEKYDEIDKQVFDVLNNVKNMLTTETNAGTDDLENPGASINIIKDGATETIKVSEEDLMDYSVDDTEENSLANLDNSEEGNASSISDRNSGETLEENELSSNSTDDKRDLDISQMISEESIQENNEGKNIQEIVTESDYSVGNTSDETKPRQATHPANVRDITSTKPEPINEDVDDHKILPESEPKVDHDNDENETIPQTEYEEYEDDDETSPDYKSTENYDEDSFTLPDSTNKNEGDNIISKLIDTFNIMSTNSVEDDADSTKAEVDIEYSDELTSDDIDALREDLDDLGSDQKNFNEDVKEIEDILKTKKIHNPNNGTLHRIVGSIYNDYGYVCLNLNLSARININSTIVTVPPNAVVKGNCSNSEIHVKISWRSISDGTVNNTIYFVMKIDGTHYYISYVHINLIDREKTGMQKHEMLDLQALSTNGQAVNKSESISFENNITLELIDANMKVREYFGSLGGSVTLAYGNAFILQIASGCICILAVLVVLGYYMYRKARSKQRTVKVSDDK